MPFHVRGLNLLDGYRGKPLEARARWLLNLRDLQHVCRPARTWVTRAEYRDTVSRGKSWPSDDWDAPKQDLMRMKRWLRLGGLDVLLETIDNENRIHVDTPELRELVDVLERRARVIDELATASAAGVEPDLGWLDADPRTSDVAEDYGPGKKHRGVLERKYGCGHKRLNKLLASKGVRIREKRRMRISERVGPERTERALRVHDEGGTLEDVRRELGLATRCSARRFLERHGRDTKPANVRQPPAPEPPRPARSEALVCAPWAT